VAKGDCEIGAHHHAWETPPCTEEDVRRHPYACALPRPQFEAQLAALTEAIAGAVGTRPVAYRSGRFGFSAAHVAALEQLAYDSPTAPGTSNLLEVPVSAALNRRLPRWMQFAYARAPWPYNTKRILRAFGIARMRWLRPSYSSLEDMIALSRDLTSAGEPVLNLLFHSSEAIVGGSPYNRTQAELDAFLDRLDRFLAFATRDLGAAPATFAEFRRAYAG
jgi:hypothetical protein